MFNFLRTRAVSMQNARITSARPAAQCQARLCSFCNFHHLNPPRAIRCTMIRCYATTDIVKLQASLQKKVKRRSKKYAELLEVTDQTTNNRKAAVHKLSSAQVSLLVNQPNITLDKLHKIPKFHLKKETITTQTKDTNEKTGLEKDLIHMDSKMDDTHRAILKESDEQLDDTSAVVENLKESCVSDHTALIKDSSFLNMLQQIDKNEDADKSQDDMLVQTPKYDMASNLYATIPFTNEKDQFDNRLSNYNLIFQLLAHMDVYIQINMLQKAFKMLTLNKNHLKCNKVSTVALYNLFLRTHVFNAHVEKAFEIYRIMKEDSVQPNFDTYALMFEIIGKIKNQEKRAESAAEVMADMNHSGISFNEIMNVSQMNATQRNTILQCIRSLDSKYCVQYRDVDIAYSCNLLKNLTKYNNYQSPAKGIVNMDELRDMMRTQIEMEKQCKMDIKSITLFTGDPVVRQQAAKRIAEWQETWKLAVADAFERNLTYLKQKEVKVKNDFKILHPFLQVLPKEEYVNAILNEIDQLTKFSEGYSCTMTNLYLTLGTYIYKRYEFQRKMKDGIIENSIQVYKKYLEWYMQNDPADRINNGRIKWQQLIQEARESGICCEMMVPEWSRNTMINIGKFLYNIIINDVKIPHVSKPGAPERQIPAFYLLFRLHSNKFLMEEIKPHPHLYRFYKDSHPETIAFETISLPTCSPPRPWVDINTGGYLISKVAFTRDPYMKSSHLLRSTPTKQLYPAFDSLNQLGSIPWKINVPILDILIQIFREGGSKELNVPQPSTVVPSPSDVISNKTKNAREMSKLLLQLKRRKNEMHALWCDCLYKLSIANHFRDKIFWMPHNLDFRGRAYPLPPHLTHLSSDLGRSILMFAQGKPLGPEGLDWLKIHTINMTGLKKKEPMHKRLEFANEILDLIVDSARNPLTGKMWWAEADEPWQTLAACKEIDNALQSPNVEEYVCRLPIHQDGSCNGLQHYAALGRDQIGAKSVNLYPSDMPQDVYSVVVSIVDEYRKIDADAGNEIAKVLEGHVSRKVMKQTVMTTVYGVTKFGARLQIARQLNDLKGFDQKYVWRGSMYLVEKTFMALQSMFESAKEIQNWFTNCARVITIRCNQYIQWVTPLGLPVIQPYSKYSTANNPKSKVSRKLDTIKQKNAFAPNFIHSLDSSHMMLTSMYCEQAGITFMSVHDCFWTHPCTVDIMNRICREQFIALHSEPILEDLSKFFSEKYVKHFTNDGQSMRLKNKDISLEVFRKVPQKGSFDINTIMSSRYFFS